MFGKRARSLSISMIICAMMMIVAHMIVPHSHDICPDHTVASVLHECCSNATISEDGHSDEAHQHCTISNVMFHPDSSKDDNQALFVMSAVHFGFTYSPTIFDAEFQKNFIPQKEPITHIFLSKDTPLRAPPVLA